MSIKIETLSFSISTRRFFSIGLMTLIAFLALISEIHAQLAVSMQVDRKNYLVYEHVHAKVTFRNYSGRGLVFGKNAALKGTLKFKVSGPNGKIIQEIKPVGVLKDMVLNPGATKSVVVSLSTFHNLGKAGNYTVKAVISHPQLKSAYKSPEIGFSVFNGIAIWKRLVGVPDVLNANSKDKIKTRNVKILNFYDEKRKLYALMVDDEKLIYGVIRLAEDVENEKPLVEVDGLSRIHIFTKIGENVYSYFVYDLNCKLEEHSTYAVSGGVAPTLVRDPKEGTVMVVGGRKAVKGRDYAVENSDPIFQKD